MPAARPVCAHRRKETVMEKLLYLIEAPTGATSEDFSSALRLSLVPALRAAGARGMQINVVDDAVAAGAPQRQINSSVAFDGMLTLWLDSAYDHGRVEAVLKPFVRRYAGYVVLESERVPNTRHPAVPGHRTHGYSQVVTLQRPPRLTHEAWFDYWQKVHAQIGIEIQSTFRYVQNIVVRRLTYDAPVIDAVVEECFPTEAMTDPHMFYNVPGDEAAYQARFQQMMDSCNRFIDFDRIEVLLTSEYVLG
jgi:hypothetical protein